MVPVGKRPWNMAITPDGRKLYVACGRSNAVAVVDTATAHQDRGDRGGRAALGRGDTPDGPQSRATARRVARASACASAWPNRSADARRVRSRRDTCGQSRRGPRAAASSRSVGTTPLPGLGVPLRDVPANVQIVRCGRAARASDRARLRSSSTRTRTASTRQRARAIRSSNRSTTAAFRRVAAARHAAGHVGVPGRRAHQRAVRRRGQLGPAAALCDLERAARSPARSPAFGLNTLGGALAIYTKSGAQFPGAIGRGRPPARSAARGAPNSSAGGARDRLDAFVTGSFSDDDGWAEPQPEPRAAVLRQGGLSGRASPTSTCRSPSPTTSSRATQTLPLSCPRRSGAGLHVSRRERERARVPRRQGQPLPLGATLLRRQRVLPALQVAQISAATSTTTSAKPTRTRVKSTRTQALNDRSTIDQTGWRRRHSRSRGRASSPA